MRLRYVAAYAVLALAVTASMLTLPGSPVSAAAGPRAGTFTVAGEVSRPLTLTFGQLAGFPQKVVTVTFQAGDAPQTHTYRGPLLADVLALARPKAAAAPKNPSLRLSVTVAAGDGYQASFAYGEIDPAAGNRPMMVGQGAFLGRDPSTKSDAVKLVVSATGTGYRIVHADATVTSIGALAALSKTSPTAPS